MGKKETRGRKPKLTSDLREMVLREIAKGMDMRGAAELAGVCYSTLKRTAQRDRLFRAQLKQAKRKKESFCLEAIDTAAKKQWQAAAWWLERVCYSRYAKRDPDIVTQGQIVALMAALAAKIRDALPQSQHAQLNEAVAEVLGAAGVKPRKKKPQE